MGHKHTKHAPRSITDPHGVPTDVWLLVLAYLHPFDLNSAGRVCSVWRKRVQQYAASPDATSRRLHLRQHRLGTASRDRHHSCLGFSRHGVLIVVSWLKKAAQQSETAGPRFQLHLYDRELKCTTQDLHIPSPERGGRWSLNCGAVSTDSDEILLIMHRGGDKDAGVRAAHFSCVLALDATASSPPTPLFSPDSEQTMMTSAVLSSAVALCVPVNHTAVSNHDMCIGTRNPDGAITWDWARRDPRGSSVGVMHGAASLFRERNEQAEVTQWRSATEHRRWPLPQSPLFEGALVPLSVACVCVMCDVVCVCVCVYSRPAD